MRYEDCDPLHERALDSVVLRKLDESLGGRAWLFGSRASLADMAILPFVRQSANADRNWFDGERWDGLKR